MGRRTGKADGLSVDAPVGEALQLSSMAGSEVVVAAGSLPVGGEGWRRRHDGFTAERRRTFLRILARTGCVADGARMAGISTTTADRWRRRDAVFAKACETALHMASSHIETLAWERAVTGIEEPVWHYGKRVGTRLKRSDAIFRLLLIASNKKKFGRQGAAGGEALTAKVRQRIEAEVRAEIAAKSEVDGRALEQNLRLRLMTIQARLRGGPEPQSLDDPDYRAWEDARAGREKRAMALLEQLEAEQADE